MSQTSVCVAEGKDKRSRLASLKCHKSWFVQLEFLFIGINQFLFERFSYWNQIHHWYKGLNRNLDIIIFKIVNNFPADFSIATTDLFALLPFILRFPQYLPPPHSKSTQLSVFNPHISPSLPSNPTWDLFFFLRFLPGPENDFLILPSVPPLTPLPQVKSTCSCLPLTHGSLDHFDSLDLLLAREGIKQIEG